MAVRLNLPAATITAFCHRWKVTELAFFGSVLREDFRPDSDIDVLVTFARDAGWSGWDLVDMVHELESILGRKVDLVEKPAIRNPFRRHEILRTAEVVYAG